MMINGIKIFKYLTLLASLVGVSIITVAQEKEKEKWGEGEIEKVEIEIVKERQIVLPKANRNFEKYHRALWNQLSLRSRMTLKI